MTTTNGYPCVGGIRRIRGCAMLSADQQIFCRDFFADAQGDLCPSDCNF